MTAQADPAELLLTWRSHPVRRGGSKLTLVIAVLIGLPVGLLILYGPFYAGLAIVVLGGSLASYFLPTDYTLYSGGGEMRFFWICRRFTWEQFRSFYPDRNGVLLSPFPRPSRLENFRGLYLRFDDCADQVLAIVAERIAVGSAESPPASGDAS